MQRIAGAPQISNCRQKLCHTFPTSSVILGECYLSDVWRGNYQLISARFLSENYAFLMPRTPKYFNTTGGVDYRSIFCHNASDHAWCANSAGWSSLFLVYTALRISFLLLPSFVWTWHVGKIYLCVLRFFVFRVYTAPTHQKVTKICFMFFFLWWEPENRWAHQMWTDKEGRYRTGLYANQHKTNEISYPWCNWLTIMIANGRLSWWR